MVSMDMNQTIPFPKGMGWMHGASKHVAVVSMRNFNHQGKQMVDIASAVAQPWGFQECVLASPSLL